MIDLPCSGRPRCTTRRQDHLLVTNALKARIKNAAQLQQQLFYDTEVLVATQTEKKKKKSVHVAQLRARRPNIVLLLNANHRQARRVWCRPRQRWTVTQWFDLFLRRVEIRSRCS